MELQNFRFPSPRARKALLINKDQKLADNPQTMAAHVKSEAGDKAIVKVIIETCLLTDEEKVKACQIAKEAGAAFVKTSTGFSSGGATANDIRLMRETVGSELGVKASGGIRDYQTAVAMIDAGANRIGASSGVALVKYESEHGII